MTTGQIYDFGPVKVVQPAQPITQSQWASIRAALSLATSGLVQAADWLLQSAGLSAAPRTPANSRERPHPRQLGLMLTRRSTAAWTQTQKARAMELAPTEYLEDIALTVGRSLGATEKFLQQHGFATRKRFDGRGRKIMGGSGEMTTDEVADELHVLAVLSADRFGFLPLAERHV